MCSCVVMAGQEDRSYSCIMSLWPQSVVYSHPSVYSLNHPLTFPIKHLLQSLDLFPYRISAFLKHSCLFLILVFFSSFFPLISFLLLLCADILEALGFYPTAYKKEASTPSDCDLLLSSSHFSSPWKGNFNNNWKRWNTFNRMSYSHSLIGIECMLTVQITKPFRKLSLALFACLSSQCKGDTLRTTSSDSTSAITSV